MIKPFSGQPKWLVALIILVVGTLFIGGCSPENQLPVISGLIASDETMTSPSSSCQIQCTAQDPDGDKLSYTWSADDGYIGGEGSSVIWTAPDAPGAYIITVEVTDGNGGIATDQITINVVVPNQPPVIESLTAEWHRLKKASNTPITCVATDPDEDELTYKWSATDDGGNPVGSFTGEGDTVTWVAPNNYGNYTITVTVSDGRGGEASDSIGITVCSCASAH
jgi:hypothetical protein